MWAIHLSYLLKESSSEIGDEDQTSLMLNVYFKYTMGWFVCTMGLFVGGL
jgi:hypothetical protein